MEQPQRLHPDPAAAADRDPRPRLPDLGIQVRNPLPPLLLVQVFQRQFAQVLGVEAVQRYERALLLLSPQERDAVVARIDFGLSYRDIAEATGSPSPNAVRMTITRALARIAKELGREG